MDDREPPLPGHSAADGSVHAGPRRDCLPCETARRTALYGTCGDCGTARDVRIRGRADLLPNGLYSHALYCPACGKTPP